MTSRFILMTSRSILIMLGCVSMKFPFPHDDDQTAQYTTIFRPWFIDAANINGTAQLHLLAHNAIKSLRALKLTERFIGSKQFTTDPPTRMLKWLLVRKLDF